MWSFLVIEKDRLAVQGGVAWKLENADIISESKMVASILVKTFLWWHCLCTPNLNPNLAFSFLSIPVKHNQLKWVIVGEHWAGVWRRTNKIWEPVPIPIHLDPDAIQSTTFRWGTHEPEPENTRERVRICERDGQRSSDTTKMWLSDMIKM